MGVSFEVSLRVNRIVWLERLLCTSVDVVDESTKAHEGAWIGT